MSSCHHRGGGETRSNCSIICLIRSSRNLAIEAADHALASKWAEWRARQERVEAEALARIVEKEEALHEDEEDVEPGPLRLVQVEPQPKVRDEQHPDHSHRSHEEAQDEGD